MVLLCTRDIMQHIDEIKRRTFKRARERKISSLKWRMIATVIPCQTLAAFSLLDLCLELCRRLELRP